MMLNFTFMLLFLIFSSGTFVSSCIYKAVGDKVEIPLHTKELPKDNHLTWTHNKTRIYSKKGSNLKGLNVDHYGSLILENLQKKQSGEYKGEVFDKDGKLINKAAQLLCVLEPVPEPSVTFKCVEKGVNLTCIPANSSDVDVSWTKNGEKSNTTCAVLHVRRSELRSGDTFSCTLSNMISKNVSKDVQPVCPDTGANANDKNSNNENKNEDVSEKKLLFGFNFWWMLVILSGGASFLLILLVICVVCVCHCSRRNERKAKEEAELRLVSLMPDHTDQPDIEYMQKSESQRTSKSLRPLPPLPGPRGPPAVQPQ